jgi:hypothetical protein
MRIHIYVSESDQILPRYGFLPTGKSVSRLPRGERWRYVRTVDTADFNLPEAVEEEMERRGFWAFGGLTKIR